MHTALQQSDNAQTAGNESVNSGGGFADGPVRSQ